VAALLANLVDRAEVLCGLLDTLESHELYSLVAELEQTARSDAFATLPSLMGHIEDLEASLADLVDDPGCMSARIADLMARTGQIDAFIADLERAIARCSRDA
jgi:hypothetical protein